MISNKPTGLTGWSYWSALLGGGLWLILWLVPTPSSGERWLIERLLLLAVLVITPLALSLVAVYNPAGQLAFPYRLAQRWQQGAALLVVLAFFWPPGLTAALLVGGWVLLTAQVALVGLVRLRLHGIGSAAEACLTAGLFYLPIGGGWLFLSRLGATPLGFGEIIVLLTAVHFHYAGFAAPILAGLAGRQLSKHDRTPSNLFRFVAVGVIAGPPLLAAGITLSPLLEVCAAFLLATGLLGLSYLTLFRLVPLFTDRLIKALLLISAGSLIAATLFAGAFAIGEFTQRSIITIPQMAQVHGLTNSLGFVLCGLLAWTLTPAEVRNDQAESASPHLG